MMVWMDVEKNMKRRFSKGLTSRSRNSLLLGVALTMSVALV